MELQSTMDLVRNKLTFYPRQLDDSLVETTTVTTVVITTTTTVPFVAPSSSPSFIAVPPHTPFITPSFSTSAVTPTESTSSWARSISGLPMSSSKTPTPTSASALTSPTTGSIESTIPSSSSNTISNTTLPYTPTSTNTPTSSPTQRTSGLSPLSLSLVLCGIVLFILLLALAAIVWIRKKRRRVSSSYPFVSQSHETAPVMTMSSPITSPIIGGSDPFASTRSRRFTLLSAVNISSPLFSRPSSVWEGHYNHSELLRAASREALAGSEPGHYHV